jgi:MFS family permease
VTIARRAIESAGRAVHGHLDSALGGPRRMRVVVALACVLGLSGADTATVGAAASELRSAFHISNTQIGLLIAVTSVVGALASVPFGHLADHVRRTWTLGGVILLWGAVMVWCATAGSFSQLLLARVGLGVVTAAAGPLVASLVGDYFEAGERGRIYGYILAGELVGVGFGFLVTGDLAAFSWRAAFVALAIPAVVLAWVVLRLPEPARGGIAPLQVEGPNAAALEDSTEDVRELAKEAVPVEERPEPPPDRMRGRGLIAATRHVLHVRTNIYLILSSAAGYYFLAGGETFGLEFVKEQYGIDQATTNVLLVVLGVSAITGVLLGGWAGDALVRRRHVSGRVTVAAVSAGLAAILFAPAILAREVLSGMPYLAAAVFLMAAQNPPLDAARLDIMPSRLWGRAEAVRTVLRSAGQAIAPVLFGLVADHVAGGGRAGLEWAFLLMLVPVIASCILLVAAIRTYPGDVAAAATLEWED